MKYDFTTIFDRYNTGSTKWDEMLKYGVTRRDIVPLSNAEMEFANAPEIKEGLLEFVRNTALSYYDPQPPYFKAVREWFEKRHDFVFSEDCIVPNCSIHAALCTAISAYTQPGDGIVVMQPTWPGFLGAVRNSGRVLIDNLLVEKDCVYSIDFGLLEKQLSEEKTKMLMLCSPHNPVGRSWTYGELKTIGDLCVKYGAVIVSDEIHADLTMPGHKHIPIATLSPEIAARTVTFTGASKAFNLAGLDSSNVIITDEEMRKLYRKARRSEGLSDPNMIGLKACELAYTKGEQWLDECVEAINSNAHFVKSYLEKYIPKVRCTDLEATYLMWLDFRALGMDCHVLEKELMEKANLFMDDGFYFGAGGECFVRMNIACPEAVLAFALERLKNWVNSLSD